ncbi:MAG: hypothetical protein V3T70_02020, partial [Phycisphaerae bacterium]
MSWTRVALLAALMTCFEGTALAQEARRVRIEQAVTGFERVNPSTRLYQTRQRITRVYGEAFAFGETPEQTAGRFVQDHALMLGAEPGELEAGSLVDGSRTRGVMFDRQTGQYKFTLVYYGQQRGGIPVFRSELRLLVRNEIGNPLVLASSSLRDLGGFRAAALQPAAL